MIGEWDVPFWLTTQFGTLPFNEPADTSTDRRFQLDPTKCAAILPVRTTDDDIPQGDGRIPHRRWRSGYTVHLAIELLSSYDADSKDGEPACGADLREMLDLLGLHFNEMIRTGLVGTAGARFGWTPTDATDDRMFDKIQLLGAPTPSADGTLGGLVVTVDFDSPFPYYIEATETDTTIASGATETITNNGNTDSFPVFEMEGGFSGFTLTNHSVQDLDGVDISLVYDSGLPGAVAVSGGDYIELEFFRETAYLNGSSSNRKAGIDWRVSDFFPLVPGDNEIEVTFTGGGGTAALAVCKSNGAWA